MGLAPSRHVVGVLMRMQSRNVGNVPEKCWVMLCSLYVLVWLDWFFASLSEAYSSRAGFSLPNMGRPCGAQPESPVC